MSAIKWDQLTQPDFDNVVETLLLADNRDLEHNAFAVNGRGGDGGIDIQIRRDGKLSIVQLKYFPEGFSGGWTKTRRAQIEKSFKSALAQKPDKWWLVVPNTLTLLERNFVNGLPKRFQPKGKRPQIVIFDRPSLNQLAAKHPDIVIHFERNTLLEAAKIYGQERALLVGREDVIARVAALSEQADTLDPDWRLDFARIGNTISSTVVARHALAAELSPINIRFNATFGPDDAELRRALERSLAFGTPEDVTLPARVVSDFTVDGPKLVASPYNPETAVSVRITPTKSKLEGKTVTVYLRDDHGGTVASHPGKATWGSTGREGLSLHATFYNTVTLQFLLPFDPSVPGQISIGLEFAGQQATDVAHGLALLRKLGPVPDLTIELGSEQLVRVRLTATPSPLENNEDLVIHQDVAADLRVVQEATDHYFPYPKGIEFKDRVYLRAMRLLLEGECIVLPAKRHVRLTLNGDDNEMSRSLLEGGEVTMLIEHPDLRIKIFGEIINLGNARLWCQRITAFNPGEALKALDAGTADGHQVDVHAHDDHGIWVFLPGRTRPRDGEFRPVSLGLPEFPDAPDVFRASETATNTDPGFPTGALTGKQDSQVVEAADQ